MWILVVAVYLKSAIALCRKNKLLLTDIARKIAVLLKPKRSENTYAINTKQQ